MVALLTGVATLSADLISLEHRQRYEAADIAKLAAITRVDHSTIFFHGYTKSGYVRDGDFHPLVLNEQKEPRRMQCRGRAVSRDGSRIAYVVPTGDRTRCRILVRELTTDVDSQLAEIEESPGPLAWSWDDSEVAYQRRAGVFAVSTRDGHERSLAHLPLRVDGRTLSGSWILKSVDWFHQRSDVLVNAVICVPTGTPEECEQTGHVLMLAPDDSRVLALGTGAAISPARDQVAFITATSARVIDADQSNGRRITSVPFTLLSIPPFLREQTWWSTVVWSPQGDRFWFSTVLDEEFNGNCYLVNVRDGKRRRILSNTSLAITDWR